MKQPGRRKRPLLRRKDCLKRDVRKTKEGDKWGSADRENRKGVTAGAVHKLASSIYRGSNKEKLKKN